MCYAIKVGGKIPLLTCVLPPELSCTAVLDRAVLAANDLKVAPNMLLTPNAMSSCMETNLHLIVLNFTTP